MTEAERAEWRRLEAHAREYRMTAREASRLWTLRAMVDLAVER